MNYVIFVNVALLATFGCQTDSKLIVKPRDTDVRVNQTTFFNCSTNFGLRASFWYHGSKHVYTGSEILEPYDERFEIDRIVWNGTYIYNLIIHSVQPGDEGIYICAEDEGVGEKYAVQLIVLDDDPICRSNKELDEVIGQNSCNIEPDEVGLECSVTYHGNIPPQMEWKKVGENSSTPLEVSINISRNLFVSSLKLRGDIALNNSSYVCESKRSTEESINCTSKVIKILYALSESLTVNKTTNDELHCNANSSQSCKYKWKWLQDNDATIESSTSVLRARKQGWHRCEAECYLRNETCHLLVMRAMIYGEIDNAEISQTKTIIIAVVVAVVVTLIVVLALICVFILWIAKHKDEADEASAEPSAANERYIADEPLDDDDDSIEEDCMPLYRHPVQPLEDINGMAILGQEVFISRLRRRIIDVYDSSTFRFVRKITVEGMANPEHIVSCSGNNCLYAIDVWLDNPNPAIQRIKPTNGELIKTWIIAEGGDRLSIASDKNVILNISHEAKLHEYTAEGELIRKIKLGPETGIIQSSHAVKLNNDLFLICHSDCNDLLSRVCLLSTKKSNNTREEIYEAELLTAFGADEEESVGRLKKPTYLSVDTQGSILVSDTSKKQAVLLSPNLDNPRILVSEADEIDLPWRTCFDELTAQWFVADRHRVLVCRVLDEQVERGLYDLSIRSLMYSW